MRDEGDRITLKAIITRFFQTLAGKLQLFLCILHGEGICFNFCREEVNLTNGEQFRFLVFLILLPNGR